ACDLFAINKMSSKGKVQTVTGWVEPSELGITMTHEHLSMTFEVAHVPAMERDKDLTDLPLTIENLWWIRQYPYSHPRNLFLNEEKQAVLEEMHLYKKNGGGCMVDNTTIGIDRDVPFLKKVADETGLKVICGAGYYVGAAHAKTTDSATEDEIYEKIVHDITVGTDGTEIKCGIIGEIGCSWPLQDREKKVLRAAARAQIQTGCPVIIHPGRNDDAPEEIAEILKDAGGDLSNTVMSHLDRTIHTDAKLLEFAKTGCYLEYDLFGIEVGLYQPNPDVYCCNDGERIRRIQLLIKEGYLDKILVAHDIHTKHRLMKYGGHGYSHILYNVVPMMKHAGVTQEQLDQILIHNPKTWLAFKK
ncbi:unnamed protein product, partial [Owenia fusiformis]